MFALTSSSNAGCASTPDFSDAPECVQIGCGVPLLIVVGIPCAVAYTCGWCEGYSDGNDAPQPEDGASDPNPGVTSAEGAVAY